MLLIKKRRSADAQYLTAILSNWHTGGVLKNEKLFSKISLYSQEKNRVAWNSMKKRLQQRWFPVAKFLGDIYFAYGCFWTDFTKWLLESLFLDSRFQNHPDSAILRKYQSLSNQIFKYNYVQNAVFIFNPYAFWNCLQSSLTCMRFYIPQFCFMKCWDCVLNSLH